jgi:hypothetical protein
MRILLALVITLLPTSLSLAFHENIPPCKAGEMGYVAHLLAEGKSYAFLSSQDPPSADSIVCNILPDQLVKTMQPSKGL